VWVGARYPLACFFPRLLLFIAGLLLGVVGSVWLVLTMVGDTGRLINACLACLPGAVVVPV
jgi:hypothetical protein